MGRAARPPWPGGSPAAAGAGAATGACAACAGAGPPGMACCMLGGVALGAGPCMVKGLRACACMQKHACEHASASELRALGSCLRLMLQVKNAPATAPPVSSQASAGKRLTVQVRMCELVWDWDVLSFCPPQSYPSCSLEIHERLCLHVLFKK